MIYVQADEIPSYDGDPWGPSTERIVERNNLRRALEQVQRNKGAPGVDGMSVGKPGDGCVPSPGNSGSAERAATALAAAPVFASRQGGPLTRFASALTIAAGYQNFLDRVQFFRRGPGAASETPILPATGGG